MYSKDHKISLLFPESGVYVKLPLQDVSTNYKGNTNNLEGKL